MILSFGIPVLLLLIFVILHFYCISVSHKLSSNKFGANVHLCKSPFKKVYIVPHFYFYSLYPTFTLYEFLFCDSLLTLLYTTQITPPTLVFYLYWFPPQNEEVLSSHHHETHEFVAKDLLNLVGLQLVITEGLCGNVVIFLLNKLKIMLVLITCLTAMLTLTEFMDPSMRTFSLSLRLITTG